MPPFQIFSRHETTIKPMNKALQNTTTDLQLGYTCFRWDTWCPITWPSKVCVPEGAGCIYLMYNPIKVRFFIRIQSSFGNWDFDITAEGGCATAWNFGIGHLDICIKDVMFDKGKLTGVTVDIKAFLPYGIRCAVLYSYRFNVARISDPAPSKLRDQLDDQGKKNYATLGVFVCGFVIEDRTATAGCSYR